MREIKLRAWDKQYARMMPVTILELPCRSIIFGHIETEEGEKAYLDDVELMQYTGLKDKNGKEIYEGDIVSTGHVIKWDNANAMFALGFVDPLCFFPLNTSHYKACEMEVIGNIYENPELADKQNGEIK